MNDVNNSYPQFRKLKDRSFYKIVSADRVEEIQRIGSRYVYYVIQIDNFANRNWLLDLMTGDNGRYEVIDNSEYQQAADLANRQNAS